MDMKFPPQAHVVKVWFPASVVTEEWLDQKGTNLINGLTYW
jgi:hypothetical protein